MFTFILGVLLVVAGAVSVSFSVGLFFKYGENSSGVGKFLAAGIILLSVGLFLFRQPW